MAFAVVERLRRGLFRGYGERSNLLLYLEYLRRDPRWALMITAGRFETVRRLATRGGRADPGDGDSIFHELDVDDAVRRLRHDGLAPDLHIGEENVAAIMEHLANVPCYVDPDPDHVFRIAEQAEAERAAGRRFFRAGYFQQDVACEPIRRVANDPKLLAIAGRYLGTATPVAEGQIHWNFPAELPCAPGDIGQAMHYDLEDYRGLRLFVYLTDVDASAGPHVMILGSHRQKRFVQRLPFGAAGCESALTEQYGKARVRTILGRAGTAFLEDPYCFHKGTTPSGRSRLLLSIVYKRRHYRLGKEAFLPPPRS